MRAEITGKARASIEPRQHEPCNGLAGMLLELRQLACMNQKQVAEVLGLSRASVANMETGRQLVTIEALEMMATHLGLEVVVTVREKAV